MKNLFKKAKSLFAGFFKKDHRERLDSFIDEEGYSYVYADIEADIERDQRKEDKKKGRLL